MVHLAGEFDQRARTGNVVAHRRRREIVDDPQHAIEVIRSQRVEIGRVVRVDCGAREPDQIAYESGWQLVPPVCPNCLRWEALTAEGVEAM